MLDLHEMAPVSHSKVNRVLERVRALGPTLRERAPQAERDGQLSQATVNDLDEAGVYKIGTPAEFGGLELTVAEQLEVIIEVSKWDGSCGWSSWVGCTTTWIPARSGRRVVEEVFGPAWTGPCIAGSSHFPATKGRARPVEGGWIVSGGPWTFGSNALWSPWINLGCMVASETGPILLAVQVPRDEVRSLDDWHVAGMRGSGSNSFSLVKDELFVPDYRGVPFTEIMAGTHDHGLKGTLWQAPTLGWAFSLMTGLSIGLAQGTLQRFLERSAGRPIRGTTYKNQLEAPLTHLMLSEVHSKIRAARLMARANAEQTDRYGIMAASGQPIDPRELQEFNGRVLVETAYGAKWCAEAIELLQRNSGSTAIMESEPIQRAWRDARVVTLHGALNLEALSENYGRLMVGLDPHKFGGIAAVDRFAPAPETAAH
jgi:alkylation response protein AidB-like acyl-CoA dehydrogenase